MQLCWILLLILYLAHAKKHRAGAVLVAACVFIQLALIPGMLMFCWTNPLAERTQRIHSYDDGQYTYETFEVDEGALGMHWYTEVRSIDKYSLVFGTFYPHYERIQQTSPIFYLQTGPV